MTISENLFVKLCQARGIRFERIVPSGFAKIADFRIWLNTTEVIVEVKQIELSDHESQLRSGSDNDDAPFIVSDAHLRIRNKFDKAKRQLKRSSQGKLPSLFVIFDNTGGLSGMDNEDFLNAMYGDESVRLSLKFTNLRPFIQKVTHLFGAQRKVGPSHNRSVSGFCRMLLDDAGDPSLIVFHNKYAKNRLKTDELRKITIRQYELSSTRENEYSAWREISKS